MTVQRILLAGATGVVGREVLGLLRARGLFVRTLSRSPSRVSTSGPPMGTSSGPSGKRPLGAWFAERARG